MRKMASIKIINDIQPISGADAIECAILGGWKVVIKKGDFAIGDRVIYCEIDSWIPNHLAPFLSKGKEPRVYENIPGERLRTVRLRGQLSQGLLLPTSCLTNYGADLSEGDEVTETLGIVKYEPPVSAQLAGNAKGIFPGFIPKTDQERIQNLSDGFQLWKSLSMEFEVTEKLDGSSMTVFHRDGEIGVCSRNLELKEDDSNTFWRVAKADGLIDKLSSVGANIALQGELVGEGIQGNLYALKGQTFYVYDIYNIETGEYCNPQERRTLCAELGIKHVPVINTNSQVMNTIDEMLISAETKSTLNPKVNQEGYVYKCANTDNGITFKVISNLFLLRES